MNVTFIALCEMAQVPHMELKSRDFESGAIEYLKASILEELFPRKPGAAFFQSTVRFSALMVFDNPKITVAKIIEDPDTRLVEHKEFSINSLISQYDLELVKK